MQINKTIDEWYDRAKKGEMPFGGCFYKGFKIATAVSQSLKTAPTDIIENEGVFWILAKNTLDRIRPNRLHLDISIKNGYIKWERIIQSEFTTSEIVPIEGSGTTEDFLIINEGLERVNSKLFSNNHFASSHFKCSLKKPNLNTPKILKIFLASSNELEYDRKEFELFVNRENKELIDKNIFLKLIIWEDFVDAMSQKGSQEEYNKAAKESDIFIMLFFTKVGPFTIEEFESAFGEFNAKNKPIIYTYFKDAPINTSKVSTQFNSVLKFQKKLRSLNHYFTTYKDINELKLSFIQQLNKLFAEKRI